MRYKVMSEYTDSFFFDFDCEFESFRNINDVAESVKINFINTPEYISYLTDNKEVDSETICIVDFDNMKVLFMQTNIETRVDIKICD